jgi:hypothetical protein
VDEGVMNNAFSLVEIKCCLASFYQSGLLIGLKFKILLTKVLKKI